ncbi:hypothetical protein A3G67_03790 [Candidatus Roizmanbacteria bacterium RIFCSPLOWO2_12_FULL_40_12]|uniref:UDP-glucose/GDP-mannose dehydrogenase dimerisation domain-containing protein n=1 Tax=Candidatus Roizmanbacteria bacterium RIFCSPLOWO2_01_FULL_40_42 TaxID=1802066 RepID=A0A1F7J5R2_9BACT|nr:MAG: hypothetical protein A2779_03425 [Candidatus Roizmanbacteria bacterium RIFCSPHIGHO2_01_FULL_40_98]OGK28386.1 MAG: hypothetical protein A3C31_00790 [Candidatus Roizmanbacteria bacterium RIFCSPHIGHO2_02_FULL_40_53]OGK30622.1 MAG: hypothetical protein A2W49_03475 [Candidatus Roizmanbacteria bacterium RIFCSPHIGHO2_12_41_18]OGK37036.1 MAG: hypothetical protein A3E69_01050 [Candidatus Roizmanbacteria bacterium RIFCSPHIGHO2_12_FULL_40_130]OGK50942.1 MAG: hypothetical protein A3B50_01560 [Candi
MKSHANGNGAAKKPTICIVGPGVVGQAQGKAFATLGYEVEFLGGNPEKTSKLQSEGFKAHTRDSFFDGTYNFDVSFLTVPTPTTDGIINLAPLTSASQDLGKRLATRKDQTYHLVVVKSTVPPGTTEDLVIKEIEATSGLKAGVDFGVCMNPEYLREISAFEDAIKPWIILIGELDIKSGDILATIYSKFKSPIVRCSLKEAEMQKYVHNLFNAVKISFYNEMRQVAQNIGADASKIFEVTAKSAEGMWNPKYGTKDHGPFTGSCLPKDTQAFHKWAESKGLATPLLGEAISVNNELLKKNGFHNQTAEIGSNL